MFIIHTPAIFMSSISSNSPNITLETIYIADQRLIGHVEWRTDVFRAGVKAFLSIDGKSKISNFDCIASANKDVGGFDIPVDQIMIIDCFVPFDDLLQHIDGPGL
jgi:hypothetical protein